MTLAASWPSRGPAAATGPDAAAHVGDDDTVPGDHDRQGEQMLLKRAAGAPIRSRRW